MDGDDERHRAPGTKAGQHGGDALVVRVEQARQPHAPLFVGQRLVAGNHAAVAHLAEGLRVIRLAIAVDDEARIAGQHGRCVQRVREATGQFAGADVPGHVLPGGQFGQAEAVEAPGERAAGVVADDQGRGRTGFAKHDEGCRIVAAEQRGMGLDGLGDGQGKRSRIRKMPQVYRMPWPSRRCDLLHTFGLHAALPSAGTYSYPSEGLVPNG